MQQFPPSARQLMFYRYVGPDEAWAIESSKIVMTLSGTGRTWYAPIRYDKRSDAKRFLALPRTPSHRVGPYPEDELPAWVIVLRRVMPAFGEPGGGWEAATDDPAFVFAVAPLEV